MRSPTRSPSARLFIPFPIVVRYLSLFPTLLSAISTCLRHFSFHLMVLLSLSFYRFVIQLVHVRVSLAFVFTCADSLPIV